MIIDECVESEEDFTQLGIDADLIPRYTSNDLWLDVGICKWDIT